MKLGLIGYPINHSLSPQIYQRLLGEDLESYELFSYDNSNKIPSLDFFSTRLNGLNITAPYKTHFANDVIINSDLVKKLGSINTLAFNGSQIFGTNTDVLAVKKILARLMDQYTDIDVELIGDGVMAKVTNYVCDELGIHVTQHSRKNDPYLTKLDLTNNSSSSQKLVINACSRDYVFDGKLTGDEIFWDYNYSFIPHLNSLPLRVKAYFDGQEMLELQAKEAINFWNEVTPKLK